MGRTTLSSSLHIAHTTVELSSASVLPPSSSARLDPWFTSGRASGSLVLVVARHAAAGGLGLWSLFSTICVCITLQEIPVWKVILVLDMTDSQKSVDQTDTNEGVVVS